METILSKVCLGPCGLDKPLQEFHKHPTCKYGRKAKCKVCCAEDKAKYDAKPEVKLRKAESHKRYYAIPEVNQRYAEYRARPEIKQYQADYMAKYNAEYYAIPENRLRKAETNAQWARDNAVQKRASVQAYRARKKDIPDTLPKDYWSILLGFYGAKCARCGTTENLELDHVIPQSWGVEKGAQHSLRNSQILCRSHNASKRNLNDNDYRDWDKGILCERYIS